MPKTAPKPPTKVQLAADVLIAAPRVRELPELKLAIKRIKALYYKVIGIPRRHALSKRLHEHYAGVIALMRSTDAKLAAQARKAMPPALIPKDLRTPSPKKR